MSPSLRDERGFTLVELMLTLSIGLVIIMASLTVLDGATRRSDGVQRRATSIQQGRAAMDHMVRSLRSQVCVRFDDVTIATPIVAASGSSVTYYSDFGDASGVPDKHTLTVASDGKVTDTFIDGTGTQNAATFTSAPVTRTVADRIAGSGTIPILRYFGFNSASPPTPDAALNSTASPTVASADLPKVARIVVTLKANPEGNPNTNSNARLTTTLQDQVYIRLADPDEAAPAPKCT